MKIWLSFIFTIIWISINWATEMADIIVAKDSSGDFTTVQEAINSIPSNNSSLKIILIKNGIYNEEICIDTDFITLVGGIYFAQLKTSSITKNIRLLYLS